MAVVLVGHPRDGPKALPRPAAGILHGRARPGPEMKPIDAKAPPGPGPELVVLSTRIRLPNAEPGPPTWAPKVLKISGTEWGENVRKVFGLLVLGGLVLLAAAGPQVRAALVQSFTATVTASSSGTPEKIWVDDEGMTHVREAPFTLTVSGDIVGTGTALVSTNFDAADNGDQHGSLTISPATGGTWAGHFEMTFIAGVGSGNIVAHGTGVLDGTMIRGNIMGLLRSDTAAIQGTIFNRDG